MLRCYNDKATFSSEASLPVAAAYYKITH